MTLYSYICQQLQPWDPVSTNLRYCMLCFSASVTVAELAIILPCARYLLIKNHLQADGESYSKLASILQNWDELSQLLYSMFVLKNVAWEQLRFSFFMSIERKELVPP